MIIKDLQALVDCAHRPVENAWLDNLHDEVAEHVKGRENYYRFLHCLVEAIQPDFCIEIGVEYGLASAHMAAAAKRYGGKVIGIDLNYHAIPGKRITNYYDKYTYIVGDSLLKFSDVMAVVKTRGRGVVFQDSSHHYQESIDEWKLYNPLLEHGSVWICDDILPAFHDPLIDPPGMSMVQYFESLPGDKLLYPEVLNHGNTVGVVLI